LAIHFISEENRLQIQRKWFERGSKSLPSIQAQMVKIRSQVIMPSVMRSKIQTRMSNNQQRSAQPSAISKTFVKAIRPDLLALKQATQRLGIDSVKKGKALQQVKPKEEKPSRKSSKKDSLVR